MPESLELFTRMAQCASSLGDDEVAKSAEEARETILASMERVYRDFTQIHDSAELAAANWMLADFLYLSRDHCADAEPFYQRAFAIWSTDRRARGSFRADMVNDYADCLRLLGKPHDAETIEHWAGELESQ